MRILYDAGHSVTGGDDPRLGAVHVVLLCHAHGDHMGDRKLKALDAGTCAAPDTVSAAPNSTTAEIAAAKNSAIVMIDANGDFHRQEGRAHPQQAHRRMPAAAPTSWCRGRRHASPACSFGGARPSRPPERRARRDHGRARGARQHGSRDLLTDPEKKNLDADNVSITLGPPSGYVIRFTNGLTVYLSGDTGMHADMKTIVSEFHKPNLWC